MPHRPSPLPFSGVGVGATIVAVLAAVDFAAGPEFVTISVFMVGPLAAAATAGWRPVAGLSVVAVALGLAAGAWNHAFAEPGHVYRVVMLVSGCLLAVVMARLRTMREAELARAAARLADQDRELASAAWARALHQLTSELVGASSPAELARAITDGARHLLGADAVLLHRSTSEPGEVLVLAGHAGHDEAFVDRWRQLERGAPSPAAQALRDKQAVVAAGEDLRQRFGAAVDTAAGAAGAVVAVPLLVRDQAVGVLTCAYRRPPTDPEGTVVPLLATVGSQAAQALDRARLLADLVEEQERLGSLQRATAQLAAVHRQDDVVAIALQEATNVARADGCVLALVAETDDRLELAGASGALAELDELRGVSWPVDVPWAISDAIRLQQPIWLADRQEWNERYPDGASLLTEMAAAGALPLLAGDEAIGALHLSYHRTSLPPEADRLVARTLADQVAQALERIRRSDHERRVSIRLQETLLKPAVDAAPWVQWGARYVPAGRNLQVGGDWYDVIERRPGHLALSVGDVVGHGLDAAVTMSELRSACRAYMLTLERCSDVLVHLSRYVVALRRGVNSTALCAMLEADSGLLSYSVAGHPPPVLVPAVGEPVVLSEAQNPLLGPFHGARALEAQHVMRPGDTLVVVTDGMVEARALAGDVCEAVMGRAAHHRRLGPQRLCDVLVEDLLPNDVGDDAVVLALRYVGPAAG